MMDAVVQFLRNAMCCIKDLHLFPDSKLQDPKHTAQYYQFPPPLDKTTPLELMISTTQLYACISTMLSGYRLIMESGYGKLRRVNNLIALHSKETKHTLADKVVMESLLQEKSAARRSIFIGINVFCIGVSFFWLFANSLHVTETNWIGGVQGLIHALTVMEVGLVPLLFFMMEDGFGQLGKALRLQSLIQTLTSGKGVSEETLNAETYEWLVMDGWSPFWKDEYGAFEPLPKNEAENLDEETKKLNTTLTALTTKSKQHELATTLNKTASRLEPEIWMLRMEGYREFLYLVINWIAFYGYMLSILVYYYDEEEYQPTHVWSLKMGQKNEDADWYGNFAGDLMWTIEPIIILASPMLLAWMNTSPSTKIKKD